MTTLSSTTSFATGDRVTPTYLNAKIDPLIANIAGINAVTGGLVFNVVDYGVATDGTDSTVSLAVVLSLYSNVYFPPGRYGVSSPLSVRSFQRLRGAGMELVSIEALGSCLTLIQGSFLSSTAVEGMTLNLMASSRTTFTAGFVALSIHTASDFDLDHVTVTGTLGPSGGGSSAAIGLSIMNRATANHVLIQSLGSYDRPHDGIYSTGRVVKITHSVAESCGDTGFVLEGCSDSLIADSTATGCAAGIAISAATGLDGGTNRISNCIISGWSAPSTGGLQIGSLGSCVLNGVEVDGLTMTQLSGGTGSAIFVRTTGAGVLTDVSLRGLTAAGSMAYLVQATGVVGMTITNVQSQTTGIANFSIGSGCSDVDISLVRCRSKLSYGVYVSQATDIVIHDCNMTGLSAQMAYGIYFDSGCSRGVAKWNEIRGATTSRVGSVSGVVPQVMDIYPNSGQGGVRFGQDAYATLFVASGESDLRSDTPFHAHILNCEGFRSGITTVIGNYTVTTLDQTVSVNSSSTVTVTLPVATSCTSQIFTVQRMGTQPVMIQATSGSSINASSATTLGTQFQSLTMQSNGTGYIVI